MTLRLFIFTLILVLISSCGTKKTETEIPEGPIPDTYGSAKKMRIKTPMETIAFGSCNDQKREQIIWKDIRENKPNLWIWLGDNIYGDTEDMVAMEGMYKSVKYHPDYLALKKNCPVIGIWDDHDYGVNDGDKNYPKKVESKKLLLDFLGVHPQAPVRQREGAYQVYEMGPEDKKIKIILLDARYFRDELQPNPGPESRYFVNETGDILGEAQWEWLEKELTNSTAKIHLIGSGIQFLPEEHGYEKWANFPTARKRFLDLLVKTKPASTILMSGDRHIAELSKMDLEGLGYPLYEITSSGLTHSYTKADESNRYRQGPLISSKNFGLLKINWENGQPVVNVEVKRGWE